eukprot:11179948-Lingulodinium_polyedra.AAC.1
MAKGRSLARALRPQLEQAAALQLAARFYVVWLFVASRFNVAGDPTRYKEVRAPARPPPAWLLDPELFRRVTE